MGTNDQHHYVSKVIKASTCTEQGEMENTCSLCGNVQISAAPLAEHDYRVLVEIRGTCVDVGVRELICKSCNYQTRTFTPKTGEHHYITMGFETFCVHCYDGAKVVKREGDVYLILG